MGRGGYDGTGSCRVKTAKVANSLALRGIMRDMFLTSVQDATGRIVLHAYEYNTVYIVGRSVLIV